MQMSADLGERIGSPAIRDALAQILPPADDTTRQSEDCLFLNLWTPAVGDGGKRPVMVWLHGGGFVSGSANWPVYDGANLARAGDVVVVSINHRLGVLGFLYLGELAGPAYLQSGNAGMLDIMLALWWVRDNIAQFGGDASNVTVFGESGGALKVCALLSMRSARGLVHKAIVQSGPGLRNISREAANENAKAVLDELGLTLPNDLQQLTKMPATQLIEAVEAARKKAAARSQDLWLAPVMDGMTMNVHPFDPIATPLAQSVPLLIGLTRDEGTFFTAAERAFESFKGPKPPRNRDAARQALMAAIAASRSEASSSQLIADLWTFASVFADTVTIAERKAAQEAPVYVYILDWHTPVSGGVLGATHGLDVPLVFGTIESARSLLGSGSEPENLSRTMQSAWTQFARSGNPNCMRLPEWPRYDAVDRATMIFGAECRVARDPFAEIRSILNG